MKAPLPVGALFLFVTFPSHSHSSIRIKMEMLHCVDPPCKLQWQFWNMKAVFDCGCIRLAYFLISLNYWVGGWEERLHCLLSISKLYVRWCVLMCVLSMCVFVEAERPFMCVCVCLRNGKMYLLWL